MTTSDDFKAAKKALNVTSVLLEVIERLERLEGKKAQPEFEWKVGYPIIYKLPFNTKIDTYSDDMGMVSKNALDTTTPSELRWIPHLTSITPTDLVTFVSIRFEDGSIAIGRAGHYIWEERGNGNGIVAYAIIKNPRPEWISS